MKIGYCLIGPRKEVIKFFDGYLTIAFETNTEKRKEKEWKQYLKLKQ